MVSNPYVDESEQGAKLLVEHPLDLTHSTPTVTKKRGPTGEPRPRGRPRKIQAIEDPPATQTEDAVAVEAEPEQSHHDDNEIAPEQAMSATEISSKVYEPKTYNEAINDPIHGRRWKEAIEDEIKNLENHHTWDMTTYRRGGKP